MPLRLQTITLLGLLAASQIVTAGHYALDVAAIAADQWPVRTTRASGSSSNTDTHGATRQSLPSDVRGWPGPRIARADDPADTAQPTAEADAASRPQQGTAESSGGTSAGMLGGSAVTVSQKGSRLLLSPPRTADSQSPANVRFGLPLVVTVAGSLAVVLGVFFLIAWAVRSAAPRGLTLLPSEVVEVLGRAPLAGRQQLHLLRCGKKLILVSVTPAGAETLTEISDPEEVDRLAGLCQQARPNSATAAFRQVLRQLAGQNKTANVLGAGLEATGRAAGRQEDADV
jgi:flagellar biogenesis protein FliO